MLSRRLKRKGFDVIIAGEVDRDRIQAAADEAQKAHATEMTAAVEAWRQGWGMFTTGSRPMGASRNLPSPPAKAKSEDSMTSPACEIRSGR